MTVADIHGPTSHVYFSQRLRLHYVDWGNRDAPPLLMVHGGRDHCRNWDWVAQELRHDYHIIAPDLRGHGDSEWLRGSVYRIQDYIYDIAQLIHQLNLAPVTILSHSLGGQISLGYTGIYPDNVKKLLAIEGLGMSPKRIAEQAATAPDERMRKWIGELRGIAGRSPRRYATLDEAFQRMHDANKHLSAEHARHLTEHGVHQNEDGSYSWKFDNYVHADRPFGMSPDQNADLWRRITCPTMLVYGEDSWASDPVKDGRSKHFNTAEIVRVPEASHWVHHDQLDIFMAHVHRFLADYYRTP